MVCSRVCTTVVVLRRGRVDCSVFPDGARPAQESVPWCRTWCVEESEAQRFVLGCSEAPLVRFPGFAVPSFRSRRVLERSDTRLRGSGVVVGILKLGAGYPIGVGSCSALA